jgi:hypothetical protein
MALLPEAEGDAASSLAAPGLRRVVLCSAQIAKRVALMSQTSPTPCCMFGHHQWGTLGGLL